MLGGAIQKSKSIKKDNSKKEVILLKGKIEKLESLVEIISRGKYMWESTFDAITDPVMIVSRDYNIERANLAVANSVNEDIVNMIGRKCYEAFAQRSEPCSKCPLNAAIRNDEICESELGNQVVERQYVVHAYPFTDAKGNINSAVHHYVDITEEKRLQQEIIQQEKMAAIGMLAGGVAHEINNPLGGVLAFTQLLLKDLKERVPTKEEIVGDIKEIEQAAIRCKKIVADLLDFSRVSKDKENTFIQLNTLIEKLFPLLKSELKSYNVDLQVDLESELPEVFGSPDRLQQVFLNLLTNGCHAMEKGGVLHVKSHFDSRRKNICVNVSDEGSGIKESDMDKIFDPFFTTKDPGSGTGLGLSISYRIIQEHGGSISVDSTEGKGSIFKVKLPYKKKVD